jgi:hypothetical protein
MKSKPMGTRYNEDLVALLKKEGKAKSYQGVHNFLENEYFKTLKKKNRNKNDINV